MKPSTSWFMAILLREGYRLFTCILINQVSIILTVLDWRLSQRETEFYNGNTTHRSRPYLRSNYTSSGDFTNGLTVFDVSRNYSRVGGKTVYGRKEYVFPTWIWGNNMIWIDIWKQCNEPLGRYRVLMSYLTQKRRLKPMFAKRLIY